MNEHKPLLMDVADFFAQKPGNNLPLHDFHIGENDSAHIGQLPNFRLMAFHVIGQAPRPSPNMPAGIVSIGTYALGTFIGDAALKLLRPWPQYGNELFTADPAQTLILDIADGLLPLSPMAEDVRLSFVCRVGEFLELALHQPGRLPAIVANIDALTNGRLTERARAILTTGTDPGVNDLWPVIDFEQSGDALAGASVGLSERERGGHGQS